MIQGNEDGAPEVATLTVMRGEANRLPTLRRTLGWCAERHIVETSPELLPSEAYSGFQVHHVPLELGAPFDGARSGALAHIQAPWVFVIDTDERLPTSLVEYVLKAVSSDSSPEGFWIARQNHVLGHPLRHSSAWPDYQLRLIRTASASFTDQIHDFGPQLSRSETFPARPELAIQHFAFDSTEAFVDKANRYTSIEARQSQSSSRATPAKAALGAIRELFARFIKMRGFRDGRFGLHMSIMMALYRYMAEAKRWERGLDTEPNPRTSEDEH